MIGRPFFMSNLGHEFEISQSSSPVGSSWNGRRHPGISLLWLLIREQELQYLAWAQTPKAEAQ
jgi:hypothetical protein